MTEFNSEEKINAIDEKVSALIRGVKKVLDRIDSIESSNQGSRRPASTDFYSPKGGQLQFAVGSPRWRSTTDDQGVTVTRIEKEGAVFVEGAPPDPANEGKLDWKNKKIVFALSDKDIGPIVAALGKETVVDSTGLMVSLVHTVGEVTKSFKIRVGTNDRAGNPTYLLELADNSTKNKVSIFVSTADVVRLRLLLESAIPQVLGWQATD